MRRLGPVRVLLSFPRKIGAVGRRAVKPAVRAGRGVRIPALTTRRAVLISFIVGLLFAVSSVASIRLIPPEIGARQQTIATAATAVAVDGHNSLVVDRYGIYRELRGYLGRATLYGELIASPPLLRTIGQRIGVPWTEISATSRQTDQDAPAVMREPNSEQRANQLLSVNARYRLDLQADPQLPVLHIYAQAPSVASAEQLANAALAALRQYLHRQAALRHAPSRQQLTLIQLGAPHGAVANGKFSAELIALTFLIAFAISLGLLLGGRAVRRGWVAAGNAAPKPMPAAARRVATGSAPARHAVHGGVRALIDGAGDWPRTTRVLPWMIAGFLILPWLIPFNTIQLMSSLPFDLKLDRILLPFLFGTWLLALVTGGDGAPKVRVGVMHVAIGLFVAAASLSILTNVSQLNRALEFDLAVKQFALLLSFALFFVIVASSVRPTEVAAFMRYSLALGVLCALGAVCEYRFHYNVFYDLSHQLLGHVFSVQTLDPNAIDELGRRLTRGPTEHPLELVGVMCMALPIALVGILNSARRDRRIMYSIAAVVMMAAAVATYRKSAFLAPIAIFVTIAYFRRRDLLKLAPLGLLSLIAVHVLAPGALGSIFGQIQPNHLDVGTVNDRTADYDAVRPDVWTHLLFGRGYGSYDHVSYRILDSAVLGRLVDIGVVGLVLLFGMIASIFGVARRAITSPDPGRASVGLAVAASAVAFGVLTFLFDELSFPHTPYLLMSLAGFLAALGPETGRRLRPRGDAERLTARHTARTHVTSAHSVQSPRRVGR